MGRNKSGLRALRLLTGKLRLLAIAVSAVTGVGLLATSPADAYTMNFGKIDVQIDNTVSLGASVRMAERETKLLPARNGGPADMTGGIDPFLSTLIAGSVVPAGTNCGTASAPSAYAQATGSRCMYNNSFLAGINGPSGDNAGLRELYNYDASMNNDDGRLNFDDGDMIGGALKLTTEMEAQRGMAKLFIRFSGFYDAVLDKNSNFERTPPLATADRVQVADVDMLDFYLDLNGQVGNSPVLVRLGRQVINWGEATFILGGNSVFNPIDVPAFRRPGSEIKEVLLPVNAIYTSFALPYDINLEAYYGGWDSYTIDAGGSPFAHSDAFEPGSSANGDRFYVGNGAYSGANRRNCAAAASTNDTTKRYGEALNVLFGTCATADAVHYAVANKKGNVEKSRQSYVNTVQSGVKSGIKLGDTDFLRRGKDKDEGSDNYGLALRWYAESLNSTEFGIYYQNYTSRIPYASSMAHRPLVGPNVTVATANSTLRGATASGCIGIFKASGGFEFDPGLRGIYASDVTGVDAAALAMFADPTIKAEIVANALNATTAVGALAPAVTAGGIAYDAARLNALITGALASPKDSEGNASMGARGTLACIAVLAQGSLANVGTVLLPNGATTVVTRYQTSIMAEYPEDIEVYGMSFNTTMFGWGVQGEVAYRPNMPLALDSDSISIAALSASCAWVNFSAAANTYYGLQTIKSECGEWDQVFHGYVRDQVANVDIGTTATFTRSNPIVSFLGADLGVFLTELGYVHMPDAGYYNQPNPQTTERPRLTNLCTSGSDLPLGGVFSLDPRTKKDNCRPTRESWGGVLYSQLQYNNVFGSAIGLNPTIAYQRGLDGYSPSPAGSFVEGVYSVNVSLQAEYQASWRASLGYTVYGGDVKHSRNVDRDFASANVSYAF